MPPPQNPAAILTAFGVAMDKSSALQLTKRCLPHLERKGQHRWGKSWGYEIISFILVYGLILHHASLRPLPPESIAPFVRWFSHAFSLVGISPRSWKSDWDWKCEAKESVPWFLASSLLFSDLLEMRGRVPWTCPKLIWTPPAKAVCSQLFSGLELWTQLQKPLLHSCRCLVLHGS